LLVYGRLLFKSKLQPGQISGLNHRFQPICLRSFHSLILLDLLISPLLLQWFIGLPGFVTCHYRFQESFVTSIVTPRLFRATNRNIIFQRLSDRGEYFLPIEVLKVDPQTDRVLADIGAFLVPISNLSQTRLVEILRLLFFTRNLLTTFLCSKFFPFYEQRGNPF
jgi:hypothetical protein